MLFFCCLFFSAAAGCAAGLACGFDLPGWYRQRREDAFRAALSPHRSDYLLQIRNAFSQLVVVRQMTRQGERERAKDVLQKTLALVWFAPECRQEMGEILYLEKNMEQARQAWLDTCEHFPHTEAASKAARCLARIDRKK